MHVFTISFRVVPYSQAVDLRVLTTTKLAANTKSLSLQLADILRVASCSVVIGDELPNLRPDVIGTVANGMYALLATVLTHMRPLQRR